MEEPLSFDIVNTNGSTFFFAYDIRSPGAPIRYIQNFRKDAPKAPQQRVAPPRSLGGFCGIRTRYKSY